MNLFEQLRREHEFGIGTIAGAAAKFGVHRRVVRQAIGSQQLEAQASLLGYMDASWVLALIALSAVPWRSRCAGPSWAAPYT